MNGFVYVMHYVNSIFHVMVSDGLAAAVEQVDVVVVVVVVSDPEAFELSPFCQMLF